MSELRIQTDVDRPVSDRIDAGWCNGYIPASQLVEPPRSLETLYGPDPYDVNFCFPYLPSALCDENTGSRLVPFIPRLHADTFFRHVAQYPEDFRFTRFPIPNTLEDMLAWFEDSVRRNPASIAFVIQFRGPATRSGAPGDWLYGGFIMLIAGNPDTLTAEVGTGLVFHEYRGKSRAGQPVSLLLRYCLNSREDKIPGLGLRKVGYVAESANYPSQALALSVGMRVESMRRWNRIVCQGKKGNGKKLRKGDPLFKPGTDDFYFIMCWDDWEAYGREVVNKVFTRKEIQSAKL